MTHHDVAYNGPSLSLDAIAPLPLTDTPVVDAEDMVHTGMRVQSLARPKLSVDPTMNKMNKNLL